MLLFVFFFIMSITGLLLGWKKNSGGYLLPDTYKGSSTNLSEWLTLDSLYLSACLYMHDSVSPASSTELERIDIRKDKGVVKFVFNGQFLGLQMDGATGKLLHIDKRRSDFIEKVHDGSILDYYSGTSGDFFKLVYTSVMGSALFVFTFTGFWLWYGPGAIRRSRKTQK